MKRKHAIFGAIVIALLALLLILSLAPRGGGDVSQVRIGFAGYKVIDGKRSLILIVTNGSSYRITQPDESLDVYGEFPGGMTLSGGSYSTSCFGIRPWGWWQFQLPKIPSVAPGATFQFTIPVRDGPYTWHVTVPFWTIPLKNRLPYALGSCLPSSGGNKAISFKVSPLPIPPAPSVPALSEQSGAEADLASRIHVDEH